jgi:hypothetical protein
VNLIQRILILLVAVPGVIYVADFAVCRVRGTPTSRVTIKQYYAIPLKGNKLQFVPADPDTEECVQSLFPQAGDRPCWYVNGHTRRRIDM